MAAHPLKNLLGEKKILSVLRSLSKAEEVIINRLTISAWNLARTALWNGSHFSAREKRKTKKLIQIFLMDTDSVERSYEEFVQRIMLARKYFSGHPGKSLALPSEWFNKENQTGFTGTRKGFLKLNTNAQRCMKWKELGWSLFGMHGKAATRHFHEKRSHFAETDQDMLNLFLAAVANQCYWLTDEIAPTLNSQNHRWPYPAS